MRNGSSGRQGNGDTGEVVRQLMEAGFTEYEGRVYLSLLSTHPASAYTISQRSGVPHSRVYDICRRLIAKGYAVSAGTNPELFSPLSPEELVDKITRDNRALTRRLDEALKTIDFTPDFDPVWNIKSSAEAIEKVGEIVAEAQKKIYIGVHQEDFALLEERLRAADARGVELFMLIYGEAAVDFGNYYFHERDHMSALALSLGRNIDCVVDSRVCVTGNLGTGGPARVVWTQNFGLVFSIENYLIHDLFIHDIQQSFGTELDAAFGRNLQKLRRKFRHLEF